MLCKAEELGHLNGPVAQALFVKIKRYSYRVAVQAVILTESAYDTFKVALQMLVFIHSGDFAFSKDLVYFVASFSFPVLIAFSRDRFSLKRCAEQPRN